MSLSNAHAVLGASSSHRWMACPGSIRMCEGLPNTTSIYADEGTVAHRILEKVLTTRNHAITYLGDKHVLNGHTFTVDMEMVEAVNLAAAVVFTDFKAAGGSATLVVERRFDLSHVYVGMYGTNDAMVGQPFGLLRVYDFKYGARHAVEVVWNSQMLYYALGASHGQVYEEIELIILQPRAYHKDGPIRRWRLSPEELDQWMMEKLIPAAKATEDPNAPLVVGEDHCTFCRARATCPAQHEHVTTLAREVFDVVPGELPPPPELLTMEQLQRILMVEPMAKAWFKSCRSFVTESLRSGTRTPEEIGFKLVHGRKTRKWASEEEAAAWLDITIGEGAYTKELISPAQAEKLFKGDKGGKAQLSELIEETRGVQLVPVSDHREALTPAVLRVFEVVNEE